MNHLYLIEALKSKDIKLFKKYLKALPTVSKFLPNIEIQRVLKHDPNFSELSLILSKVNKISFLIDEKRLVSTLFENKCKLDKDRIKKLFPEAYQNDPLKLVAHCKTITLLFIKLRKIAAEKNQDVEYWFSKVDLWFQDVPVIFLVLPSLTDDIFSRSQDFQEECQLHFQCSNYPQLEHYVKLKSYNGQKTKFLEQLYKMAPITSAGYYLFKYMVVDNSFRCLKELLPPEEMIHLCDFLYNPQNDSRYNQKGFSGFFILFNTRTLYIHLEIDIFIRDLTSKNIQQKLENNNSRLCILLRSEIRSLETELQFYQRTNPEHDRKTKCQKKLICLLIVLLDFGRLDNLMLIEDALNNKKSRLYNTLCMFMEESSLLDESILKEIENEMQKKYPSFSLSAKMLEQKPLKLGRKSNFFKRFSPTLPTIIECTEDDNMERTLDNGNTKLLP